MGAAPAKCIEFDGMRSLIAGACWHWVAWKVHCGVRVVVEVRLPIVMQCDGINNGWVGTLGVRDLYLDVRWGVRVIPR